MKFILTRTSAIRNEDVKVDNKKYNIKKIQVDSNKSYGLFVELLIEINSLEELMELQKDYGDIIIKDYFYNKNLKEIEIYDTYRE